MDALYSTFPDSSMYPRESHQNIILIFYRIIYFRVPWDWSLVSILPYQWRSEKRLLKGRFISSRHQHLSRHWKVPICKRYSILQHWPEGQGPVGILSRDRGKSRHHFDLSLCLAKVAGTILFYYRFYSKFFPLGECHFTFQLTSIVSVLLVCFTKPGGHHLFIFSFSRCQLHALHISHSTDSVSPRGGLLHMSDAPAFILVPWFVELWPGDTSRLTGSGGCQGLCSQFLQDYNQQRKIS